MKLAVALAVLPAAAAFVGPAAAPAETRLSESKSDLEALAKGLNPTIGFWDPLNVAGASGSLYGFNNEQTIAWYRQAEIKHGRVAMAAFVGYCVQANGGHWATKMTLGGADWPSGSPPEQWDALPAASKWQTVHKSNCRGAFEQLFILIGARARVRALVSRRVKELQT